MQNSYDMFLTSASKVEVLEGVFEVKRLGYCTVGQRYSDILGCSRACARQLAGSAARACDSCCQCVRAYREHPASVSQLCINNSLAYGAVLTDTSFTSDKFPNN